MKNNRQNPIYSSKDDKLNRKNFVDYAINIIENAPVKNRAYTISVNGKWGEGKTSVKNLIIEKLLCKIKAENIFLMDFNFVEFQNQTELNKVFFAKLLDALKNRKHKILNIISNNKKFIFYLFFFMTIAAGFLYPNIFVRFSSVLLTFLFVFKTQLRKVTVASLVDVVSRFYVKVDVMYKILFYNPTKEKAENSKLISYLDKNNYFDKIIIFIDSFDSLETNQLRALMHFVSAKLDLPKIVFVLFFDKSILERCLNTNAYSGADFIEKFVNIQLDLPLITDDILFNFLCNELQEKYDINIKYLSEFKYVKNYFTYLNKIYTFLDNFDLNYTLIINNLKNSGFMFNKNDFFLMEVLRFFDNDLYRVIRRNKRILTKHNLKINIDKNSFWPDVLASIKNNSEENIKSLLLTLFPYLPIQLGLDVEENYKYDENKLAQDKNVGCFDYFDYYFVYEVDRIVISEENFEIIKNCLGNNKEFVKTVREIFSVENDKDIFKYAESILRKLHKRVNEAEVLDIVVNSEESKKEFLKNVIWLYIYNNKNTNNKDYLITILSEYVKLTSINKLLDNLQLILDEFNYFNYFYTLEILGIVKRNLLDLIKLEEKEKYVFLIGEINNRYVNLMFNEEILKYLSKDSFDSKLQLHHIIDFVKNKTAVREKLNSLLNDPQSMIGCIELKRFEAFQNLIEDNYFNLVYFFVEQSVKRKIIGENIYVFIDQESLYPFTINGFIGIFKKHNIPRKDKLFKLLIRNRK